MPAAYIRNRKLREIYKKEETEEEDSSSYDSDRMRLFGSPSISNWFGTRDNRRGRKFKT